MMDRALTAQAGMHYGAVRGGAAILCAAIYVLSLALGSATYSPLVLLVLGAYGVLAVLEWSGRLRPGALMAPVGYLSDIAAISVVTASSAQLAGLAAPLYYQVVAGGGVRHGGRVMVALSLACAAAFIAAASFNPVLGAFPYLVAGIAMSMPVFALLLVFLMEATVGMARTFEDRIRALSRRLESANGLAARDASTGAYSRALFMEQLERSIAVARRCGLRVVVVRIELPAMDDIRAIHGEQAAESVMRGVVAILCRALRASDVVGRYDASTLMICVGPVMAAAREDIMDRLRDIASWLETDFSVADRYGDPVRMRIVPQMGYAVYPDDGLTPTSLLAAARSRSILSKAPRRERTRRTDLARGRVDAPPASW